MPADRPQELEELRLAELLRRVNQSAVPPDREFLEALRNQTAEIFTESAASSEERPPPALPPASLDAPTALPTPEVRPADQTPAPDKKSSTSPTSSTRTPMLTLAFRGIAALIAVVSLFSAWLVSTPERVAQGGVPFSKVLEQLREADTLQFRVLQGGRSADVWLRRPGLARREESPQRYDIAAGSRLWKVDESTNTVVEGDSPWFLSPDKQIDLLSLLEVGVVDAGRLQTALPHKRTDYLGHDCDVYESIVDTREGNLRIVAYSDAQSHQLRGIAAWPAAPKPAAAVPLAELQLVAVNPVVDDETFVVSKSLAEDGRIGKVSAAQGVVLLRPLLAKRWTPISRGVILKTGDWIQTDLRGANAVRITLTSNVEVTLGPGALLETTSPAQARLHAGTAQVQLPKGAKSAFELLAPRTGSRKFTESGKTIVEVNRDEQLVDIKQTPVWLAGFEGASSNESLGSLIVNIDGRQEPLTVGYHKVNVEIRDQIARTTIEESFVNHTDGRLEGIFHFPLPQDASISGFGMWIGNDLVEADVVEKQRAREIFETILREKRDPGLLEWTGGNIFKARVFPIEAHSEKRVKIVYTQVLPLRANRYRYSYGLRSELLQLKPLRELTLTVTVSSALGLKNITCPSHGARIQKTANSGQVEFTAQEYTPNRDYEIVCEIDSRQSDVVVVPHRRGSDGYFLMQLAPPGSDGNWQRELVPEGAPLKLVLLCDTSASMDTEKRRQQREFVATVLASLGPNDRFQLAAADVGTVWPFSEPVAPSKENISKVRMFLDERISLGWTDLNRAFEDILKKAPADAQVIYIGDGIVTAGDFDPQAFVSQLRRLILGGDKTAQKRGFHAVTVGSSFESAVVKGIAGLAGGSVRSISGEQSPQTIALELLNELAQPGFSDLNVEFRGVKVAAVYPDKLPNVAAGMQQILVGRYLPEGKDQQGEVVVTGKRGGEAVRYVARINLKDAEEGNSFIPRLWAREHLEQLLQQGRSQTIRDQIIALSEEFHIMTPYTSLLVLESDADRERFGVKRRYEMRDGEQFFADGRAKANFELLQQQMKRAGDWRVGMRRKVLRGLLGLGRNPGMFSQYAQQIAQTRRRQRWGFANSLAPEDETAAFGRKFIAGFNQPMSEHLGLVGDLVDEVEVAKASPGDRNEAFQEDSPSEEAEYQGKNSALRDRMDTEAKLAVDISDVGKGKKKRSFNRPNRSSIAADDPFDSEPEADGVSLDAPAAMPPDETFEEEEFGQSMRSFSERPAAARKPSSAAYPYRGRWNHGYQHDYTNWLNELFPNFGTPDSKTNPPLKSPEKWTAEALAISKSLDGRNKLSSIKGGLETRQVNRGFDPRWNRRTYQNASITLYSPRSWLVRPDTPDGHTLVSYCDGRERGVYSLAILLGRFRPAIPQDLTYLQVPLYGRTTTPWHETYREYTARVEPAGENRATLIITSPNGNQVIKYLIDTQRNVQLKQEAIYDGKFSGSTVFDDFIQINGVWWARKQSHRDAQDRVTSESLAEIRELTAEQHANRMAKELELKPRVQFLPMTLPKLSDSRRKAADGSADFSDRIVLLMSFSALQQWPDVLQQIDAIEKLASQKPGIRWLRTLSLQMMRRNEEARTRYLAELDRLVKAKVPNELFLTEFILNHGSMVGSVAEHLELLQKAKPVFDRQPAEIRADHRYESRLATLFDGVGRTEESLAVRKKLATELPWDVYTQTDYAMRLRVAGRKKEALEWLRKEIDRKVEWNSSEEEALRNAYAEHLRQEGDWIALQKFTAEWIARNPEQPTPYSQHISALYFNDQLPAAYALADQWLQESRIDGKLRPDQKARLDATLNFALGSAYNLSFQRVDGRWLKPLADAVRFFVNHKHHYDVARRIMDDYRFSQTETGDRLRGEFLVRLQNEAKTLSAWQLTTLSAWTLSQHARIELQEPIDGRKQLKSLELPLRIWEGVADEIHSRWSRTEDKNEKFMLGERLVLIYSARFHDTRLLPFMRERVIGAPPEYKQDYLTRLYDDLLQRPWTPEIETECFTRLRELSIAEQETERLAMQLPALLRLVDSLVSRRIVHDEKQWRDKGGLDQLKRPEVAKKRAEISTAARKAVSERLSREANQEQNKTLADWFRIEQSWLDVSLQQRLAETAEQCWKIVGEVPPKPLTPEDWDNLSESQQRQRSFDSQLRHRAWTTLMYLAARRDATPQAVSRVLKYIDAGLDRPAEAARPWRLTKFRLLIALDRPDDLERELQAWVRADAPTAPWRVLLAYLTAERGKIAEAVTLFEVAEKDKLLSSRDVRQLADWYLVLNRRDDYERTRIAAFKLIPENHISNLMYQVRNRYRYNNNNKLTSDLDENTLFMIRALFEKSSNPENYLHQLRDLYAACRDFRLLQMIPDAVLGRSPQQIYRFLEALRHQLLSELRNEAAADPIIARIRELRRRDLTSTDLRALDLLEVLIERKSSELLNQPGPHIENCLAALKLAFSRQWTDGEPLMMAYFLRQMEKLPHPSLVDEQLRQMQALRQLTKSGSREHLQITTHDCVLRFRYYGRQEEALRDMSAEVALYEAANGGRWPAADNDNLDTYIGFYESLQRYLAGEAILFKYSAKPEHDDQKRWLDARLVRLYNAALAADGEVTLGTRSTLFNALVKRFQTDVEAAPDENVRHNLVSWFSDTLRIGFHRMLPEAGPEIRKFAFLTLPGILGKQQSQYRNTAQVPVYMFRDTVGYHDALRYIIERMEQYPRRFSNTWGDAWNTFGHQLAEFRHQGSSKVNLADLEPRILELTLQELRHEMQTGEGRSNGIYHQHNTYYWKENEADFIRFANDVYSENSGSGRVAVRVATYLWNSSNQQDSAIAILLMAHRRGILEDQEINTLVSWLESRGRNAEAIPLLQALIRTYPDIINYYTRLMRAYHFTKQPQMLAELLQQAEQHFHQGGRWTESNMAELAHGCYTCGLPQKAIQYYDEALSLCKRDNPFSHRANYLLYERNYHLARAYSAVGDTIKAVDAISEAIVVAPGYYYQGNQAVTQLREVMSQSQNLDAYVEHVDKESAKTGKDSPIIRKALGLVYASRNDHARAIKQFELALALQPQDRESQEALVKAYDASGRKADGTRQILRRIDFERHNLNLYQQLADRLRNDDAEAERAATSLIESAPNESESHAAFAQLRQQQNRWGEAIPHWRQVARLRRLEPTGLLELAKAQLHEKRWDDARSTLDELAKTTWAERFGKVSDQVQELRRLLPK